MQIECVAEVQREQDRRGHQQPMPEPSKRKKSIAVCGRFIRLFSNIPAARLAETAGVLLLAPDRDGCPLRWTQWSWFPGFLLNYRFVPFIHLQVLSLNWMRTQRTGMSETEVRYLRLHLYRNAI